MTNEQIQALKAQMKRKHRDWSATVMRTCDYCGDHKDTVTEEDGSNICASCCDDEHAANLENIAELEAIRAAAEKLVRCKGRYHSEQNYRALAALFGVNVPDLPPLDCETRKLFTCSTCGREGLDEPPESRCDCGEDGAHWLEGVLYTSPASWRTLTVKLPPSIDCSNAHFAIRAGRISYRDEVIKELKSACAAAGIKLDVGGGN